jgi:hypothetical protein
VPVELLPVDSEMVEDGRDVWGLDPPLAPHIVWRTPPEPDKNLLEGLDLGYHVDRCLCIEMGVGRMG